MLLDREIGRSMRGVRGMRYFLLMHGMEVINHDLPTATSIFTPSEAPFVPTPREVAPPKSAVTCAPSLTSPTSEEEASEAGSFAPPDEPRAFPESWIHEPHQVALEWFSHSPWMLEGPVMDRLRVLGQHARWQRRQEGIPYFYQIWDWKSRVDGRAEHEEPMLQNLGAGYTVVVWHVTSQSLELQADSNFSTTTVRNSLAREIGLSHAKMHLLQMVNDVLCYDEIFGTPLIRHPDVIRFFSRFKANVRETI